jgi:hypothetical protein
MPVRKLTCFQFLCAALCFVAFPSGATKAQSESSLSARIVEALKGAEPDWKYIGYLEFPLFSRVSSERRIITGIWTNPQTRSKDVKVLVYSLESRGKAAKWLTPVRDQQFPVGWQVSTFQIGDEGYLSNFKNGDRFDIEFRRGTVAAKIEGANLAKVKEFAQTVVEQIRAN